MRNQNRPSWVHLEAFACDQRVNISGGRSSCEVTSDTSSFLGRSGYPHSRTTKSPARSDGGHEFVYSLALVFVPRAVAGLMARRRNKVLLSFDVAFAFATGMDTLLT
jgi:hypothetical protein